ncbi:MAG TPA: hypothetical protein VKD28_14715 [Gemmatimonadales bacterium]|nr:hypothetical protein [Gemmatimonadales bacterium]
MDSEPADRNVTSRHRVRLILVILLTVFFVFAWLLFAGAYYITMRNLDMVATEPRAIVIHVLGLLGALNVMVLCLFFITIILWARQSRADRIASRVG